MWPYCTSKYKIPKQAYVLEILRKTSFSDVKRSGCVRVFSIRKVFFETTMTMVPKAILICSLFTTYFTKAVAIDRWCPDGAGEWNDRYINAANGLAHSRRSAEVLWSPGIMSGAKEIGSPLHWGTADEGWQM